jgi:hypothetical protein
MATLKVIDGLSTKRKLYIQGGGLKTKLQSKVETPSQVCARHTKGDRRKIRKALRKYGRADLAVASLTR